jgi:L-asparaginase
MTIGLITTGGTIDKRYGAGLGIREMEIGSPYAPDFFRKHLGGPAISHLGELRKDSLDITDTDRAKIVTMCAGSGLFKILITHDTDTMLKTAEAIERSQVAHGRTVVLTGALQPACVKESDADFNLGLAFGALKCLPYGVYIAMNGIHEWADCLKDPDTGFFLPKR